MFFWDFALEGGEGTKFLWGFEFEEEGMMEPSTSSQVDGASGG